MDDLTRRNVLRAGGAALAGLAVMRIAGPAQAFPGNQEDETVIDWVDQPAPLPPGVEEGVGHPLIWERLQDRIIPANEFFTVKHYGEPPIDAAAWRVDVRGLVARPQSWSLADLRARNRREVEFTLECSGNTGLPFFIGGVGNAAWGGTSLAEVLRRARPLPQATEVVFWGADSGPVDVPGGWNLPSPERPDSPGPGGTISGTEYFARSMSIADAMAPDNLLCYEMNGQDLTPEHGAPVRLIAPGWYGVANVKWLNGIEVVDQRFAGRFMAREYVTIREEERDGQTVWTFATVGHARLKSAPARVTRRGDQYMITGVAWGAPIEHVEVRIDGGPWTAAVVTETEADGDALRAGYTWTFWTFDWGRPAVGEHTVECRAFDTDGNVQPAPDDPFLTSKLTYWESNGWITRRVNIT